MFCKYCGNQIPDNSRVCTYCGQHVAIQNVDSNVPAEESGQKKNRMLPLLIIMSVLVICLLIAVVVMALAMPAFREFIPEKQPDIEETVSSTEPVTEATEPPTEATEPPTEATESEVTATEYYAPYTDENGIYYVIVEPYPIPIANPQKDIYDAPAGNYIGDFNTIGYYTIVEQAEDPNGYTWGKLSTGEGWTMVYQQILPNLDMTFCSGAGAWSTGITIKGTGFFNGDFRDSDMGDGGYNYPYGTVYTCEFDGKFNVVDIGRHGVSLKLADINTKQTPGKVWYEGGVRYIASEPYGLEDCVQFILYIPGTPATQLPEEMKYWLHGAADSGTLNCYALYNPATGDTFVS